MSAGRCWTKCFLLLLPSLVTAWCVFFLFHCSLFVRPCPSSFFFFGPHLKLLEEKKSLKAVGGVNISGSESGKKKSFWERESRLGEHAALTACVCVTAVLTLSSYNQCLNGKKRHHHVGCEFIFLSPCSLCPIFQRVVQMGTAAHHLHIFGNGAAQSAPCSPDLRRGAQRRGNGGVVRGHSLRWHPRAPLQGVRGKLGASRWAPGPQKVKVMCTHTHKQTHTHTQNTKEDGELVLKKWTDRRSRMGWTNVCYLSLPACFPFFFFLFFWPPAGHQPPQSDGNSC